MDTSRQRLEQWVQRIVDCKHSGKLIDEWCNVNGEVSGQTEVLP